MRHIQARVADGLYIRVMRFISLKKGRTIDKLIKASLLYYLEQFENPSTTKKENTNVR